MKLVLALCFLYSFLGSRAPAADGADYHRRVATVTSTPGCVAFWDFVKREPAGARRFTAHVPPGQTNEYALDAGNYVREYWGEGREATYADFPLLGRGPFGQAVRICSEEDPTFRPLLFVSRARLHDSPLDIKGSNRSVTVVVWAIRESGNHALAGIWHEGTDLKQASTTNIQRAVRGQRQYGLFAGLNKPGSACGHVSENGAGSFAHKYAMHKCNSGEEAPAVPANSPPEVLDQAWQCFAMTFDHERNELTGWLNGKATERWQENVKLALPPVYKAWLQGELHRRPGRQPGEDASYPADQFYNPPEGKPLSVRQLRQTAEERVELHEFPYTRVEVVWRRGEEGKFAIASRDLAAVCLNPWWFPHDLYAPPDASVGAPFTIGRVIHSSRSVGFTGWIGGVAVFDRALNPQEMATLSDLGRGDPIAVPSAAARIPSVIFDTDMGSDCDDAGALAVLHALADASEIRILGVIFSSGRNKFGVGTCDAINTWYGRGDLPLGQYKGTDVGDPTDSYTRSIAIRTNVFGHDTVDDAPELVSVYRSILEPQPDRSVTILTVGHPHGLVHLMRDQRGMHLVRAKVERWVAMGMGGWNFEQCGMSAYSEELLRNWPAPFYLSPAGADIITGNRLLPKTPDHNPVREAYRLWRTALADGRSSWDQVATLFVARPALFKVEHHGRVERTPEGPIVWNAKVDNPRHYLVTPDIPHPQMAGIIEELMARPPKARALPEQR